MEKLRNKFDRLCQYKYFYELYCLAIFVISLLTWLLMPTAGLIILMLFISAMLFFTNDIKYILPGLTNFIFVNGENFRADKVPVGLIIAGALLVLSLVFYFIKNKPKIKLGKFGACFIGLTVAAIIPIFWSAIKHTPGTSMMYFLYFNWLLYLLVYIFMVTIVKVDLKKELAVALSYMGLLIAFECIVKSISLMNTVDSIFDLYYYLGWGLCNEAGIMMLVALPFVFYLISAEEMRLKVANIIKLIIFAIAMVLTTSRATYLCGLVELFMLFCVFVYNSKHKKIFISCFAVIILAVLLFLAVEQSIINSMMEKVFKLGITLNGREGIYDSAIAHFKESPLTVIFGDGIACEFETATNGAVFDEEIGTYRVVVFHSTFFHTLATMGIVGIVLMLIHFIQKYWLVFKNKSLYAAYLFVGFFCVDVYGMIDNTYHMYYYMIILVIILGVIENSNCKEEVKNE